MSSDFCLKGKYFFMQEIKTLNLGELATFLQKERGLTQTQVGEIFEVRKQTVNAWVRGITTRVHNVNKLKNGAQILEERYNIVLRNITDCSVQVVLPEKSNGGISGIVNGDHNRQEFFSRNQIGSDSSEVENLKLKNRLLIEENIKLEKEIERLKAGTQFR